MSSSVGKGYVHIYTGCGKGKTTAAVGLAARALGSGLRVYVGQFIKGKASSEFITLQVAGQSRFTHALFGRGRFISGEPDPEDIQLARNGLTAAVEKLQSGQYDLIVLDEIFGALHAGLLSEADILSLISLKPDGCELVLTGRNAPLSVIEAADLVSDIQEIKHYYKQGVSARSGIEM